MIETLGRITSESAPLLAAPARGAAAGKRSVLLALITCVRATISRGRTMRRVSVLFLLAFPPGVAKGQELLSWRNYEPGVHRFVPDSVGCGRRASELTEGLTETDRLAEYDRC